MLLGWLPCATGTLGYDGPADLVALLSAPAVKSRCCQLVRRRSSRSGPSTTSVWLGVAAEWRLASRPTSGRSLSDHAAALAHGCTAKAQCGTRWTFSAPRSAPGGGVRPTPVIDFIRAVGVPAVGSRLRYSCTRSRGLCSLSRNSTRTLCASHSVPSVRLGETF